MSFKQQNVAHSWSTSAVAMLAALLGCNGGGHSGNNDAPPAPEQGHRRELTLTSPVQTQAGQNLDCGGITVSMPLTTGDMVVEDVLFTVGTGNSAVLARAGLERLRSALTTCVRPALSKVMIFGLLIAGLTCHIAQAQTALAPTQPLVSAEGELVGYATFDTDTYFLVPSAWLLARDARGPMATLSEVATDPSTYNLRVVLEPSYTKAAAVVVQLRRSNPNALFLPLPTRLTKVQLYLPRALGAITASLEPDSQFPSPLAVYYRVKLNAGQVNILRDLAQGGVTLQGAVTYAYVGNGGEQRTSTPLTIQLDPSIFIRRQNTDRSLAWLSDMLAKSELYRRASKRERFEPLYGGPSPALSEPRCDSCAVTRINGGIAASRPFPQPCWA